MSMKIVDTHLLTAENHLKHHRAELAAKEIRQARLVMRQKGRTGSNTTMLKQVAIVVGMLFCLGFGLFQIAVYSQRNQKIRHIAALEGTMMTYCASYTDYTPADCSNWAIAFVRSYEANVEACLDRSQRLVNEEFDNCIQVIPQ